MFLFLSWIIYYIDICILHFTYQLFQLVKNILIVLTFAIMNNATNICVQDFVFFVFFLIGN